MAGKFIVIEGTDGSGKGTQYQLLLERLQAEGYNPVPADFPRYGQPSAYFVEKYLNGGYGTIHDTGPKAAALFYALDRFDAAEGLRKHLASGRIVLSNRYVGSNMGHQGSKIENDAEREKFFRWIHDLEYGILNIPKPTINIFLHVPADVAFELVAKKAARGYLNGKTRDIHEADLNHISRTEATYEQMTTLFPEEYKRIECAPGGELMSIEAIHELIWAETKKHI